MKNSKGTVFYGLHFYPGVAEYSEPGKNPYRVFLNENTIRSMGPTFAGRPVFVTHVDGVEEDVDELRKGADGWVIESFYNEADGKHWVKFIAVTEKAEQAIKQGWQLSNCYIPKSFSKGGLWNGVTYAKEVTGGEYEHLAIVPNPRYAESVVLTPEKFKQYNEEKLLEVKRLSNAKEKSVKISLFKKEKVTNSDELLEMSVMLPKSKKDVTIGELVEEADARRMSNAVDLKQIVEVDDEEITVGELLERYENAKKCNKDDPDEEGDPSHGKVSMKDKDVMNEDDDMDDKKKKENEDDEDDMDDMSKDKKKKNKMKKKKNAREDDDDTDVEDDEDEDMDRKSNELEEARKKKEKAKEKADRIRNAERNASDTVAKVEVSMDQVARGKARYGSK